VSEGALPTVLIAAAEDAVLSAIAEEFPHQDLAPLAARGWAQVEASLGDLALVAAVVHHRLQDLGAVEFCRRLRGLPGRLELPIVLLLPGVARSRQPGDPFDVAMRFPCGPGVLADNLAKVISQRDERLSDAVDALEQELRRRMEKVEQQSYYEILGVDRKAPREAVVAAYDAFSLRFHPDRLKQLRDDPELSAGAAEFYLLVTEAYQTLLDRTTRKRYEQLLAAGKLRYDPSLYQTADDLSQISAVDNAKRYLRLAQRELERGDTKAALVFFQMAKAVDPDNAELARRMRQLEARKR
jgi:hypothetical protein